MASSPIRTMPRRRLTLCKPFTTTVTSRCSGSTPLASAWAPTSGGHGVAFIGNNGTLVVDRGGWELLPEQEEGEDGRAAYKLPSVPRRGVEERGLHAHTSNFVDCVKTRDKPRCPIELGELAAVNCQLGNIAFRVGDRLEWDKKAGAFVGNNKAAA